MLSDPGSVDGRGGVMQELVPVVIGIVVGLVAGSRPRGNVLAGVIVAALASGFLVAWVVGELAHSVGYGFVDAGVIALTAVLVMVAHRLVNRDKRDTVQETHRG
jgi:hypothetical protein